MVSIKKSSKLSKKTDKNSNKKLNYVINSLFIIILFTLIFLILKISFASYSIQTDTISNHTVVYDADLFFTYEINRYPTHVEISDITEHNISVGFSLEPSSLNFGVVPTGGNSGKRFITLQNTLNTNAKILLDAYGNISSLIHFSDDDFSLSPGVLKDLEIVLETKKNTAVGDYSGEIVLVVKRPKYAFLGRLL